MKKLFLNFVCLLLAVSVAVCGISKNTDAAAALESKSRSAFMIDVNSGEVLFKSNENEKRPIASMVKIMTLLLVFEAADSGKINLSDTITVSQNAASMGGSQAFLDAGHSYKIEELVTSIAMASANDSCVALAEHLQGSVENFVSAMNDKAAALGMKDTVFVNSTGLPAPGQFSTAKDVSTMFRELIKHEKYFEFSQIWMKDMLHPKDGRVTGLTNTNKLVRFYAGCDGGKTGFTSEAMHCLAATAKRNDTRLVAVVVGAPDSKTRFNEVSEMFNYGFANFESKIYLAKGEILEQKIPVRGGKAETISITAEQSLVLFGKKGESKGEISIELLDSLKAPVKKGDVVGTASIKQGENVLAKVNIVSNDNVDKKTFTDFFNEIVDLW